MTLCLKPRLYIYNALTALAAKIVHIEGVLMEGIGQMPSKPKV